MMTGACPGRVGRYLPRTCAGDCNLLATRRTGSGCTRSAAASRPRPSRRERTSVCRRDEKDPAHARARIISTVKVLARRARDERRDARARLALTERPPTLEVLVVCVYDDTGGLVWSDRRWRRRRGGRCLAAYAALSSAGEPSSPCRNHEKVLVHVVGSSQRATTVINTVCATVGGGLELSKELARTFTSDATAAYVLGPQGSWDWQGMFRGMLGCRGLIRPRPSSRATRRPASGCSLSVVECRPRDEAGVSRPRPLFRNAAVRKRTAASTGIGHPDLGTMEAPHTRR